MLVVLPHGLAVDPEIVKLVSIRSERGKAPGAGMRFVVVMKTDAEETLHVIAAFGEREEAESLSRECAKRVNKALGAEEEEDEDEDDDDDDDSSSDDADDSSDDDDDDW